MPVAQEAARRPPDNSVHPLTREEWRDWLAEHHARKEGVWVVTFKKGAGPSYLDREAVIEEALCFGWIDSKPGKLDDRRAMLWCAPRRPGAAWSRLNKARAARLIADGRMTPAGLAKIEAGKADGSWRALDEVEALVIPQDLEAAFRAHPDAQRHFEAFPRFTKRAILEWISAANWAQTRARRVEETARLAQSNLRANQWRP